MSSPSRGLHTSSSQLNQAARSSSSERRSVPVTIPEWTPSIGVLLLTFSRWLRRQAHHTLPPPKGQGRWERLSWLLLSCFTEAELRQWIRTLPDGERLSAALPAGVVSNEVLVFEVIFAFERHGMLDDSLFDHLVAARPRREQKIRAVQATWSA